MTIDKETSSISKVTIPAENVASAVRKLFPELKDTILDHMVLQDGNAQLVVFMKTVEIVEIKDTPDLNPPPPHTGE